MSEHSYIDRIHSPGDLRTFSDAQLRELCQELRDTLIQTVSRTGGHLSSNLGVVELTVALHREFDLPQDQIVWDVGHQCYVHKLLTGRADRFDTLRQEGGLSGFPCPEESEYDCFITGHSSTSISAANGLAKAKTLSGRPGYVIAVIGDGALTGGLSYEGLCNAGRSKDKLIVILNDNRMSINRNVGYVARHLSHMRSRPNYVEVKHNVEWFLKHVPLVGQACFRGLLKMKNRLKTMVYRNSTIYEEMGFHYLGPVDGHNLADLRQALRAAKAVDRPVLLHVETVKGRGYPFAEENPDIYHGVCRFDIVSGKIPPSCESFSTVFGRTMTALAREDSRICAVTAAMTDGTGLGGFQAEFSSRCFDTGIAEEHAVTFCSGLAQGGMLPVFAVYSTFLQRSYDQILNDTAILGSHIVLAIDRAGLVPDDGKTHQGIFDVPFLQTIPGMTIYAPSCFSELERHLRQALYDETGPVAVRYPKGGEPPVPEGYQPDYRPYHVYGAPHADTLLVTYGRIFFEAVEAARRLETEGTPVSILKLTRIKPLDEDCIRLISSFKRVLFFEEGSRTGGIGEYVAGRLAGLPFTGEYELRAVTPFVGTCKTAAALHRFHLDADGMIQAVRREGCDNA